MDVDGRLRESLKDLLDGGSEARLTELLQDVHPADLAPLLRDLPLEQQITVFRLLPSDRAGEVLSEVDDKTLIDLVRSLDDVEVSRILDEMPPDHAAEVVEELPEEHAEKLLDLMTDERSEDVQELLEYQEKTAGRLMSPNVVAVNEAKTVGEAIDQIRKSATEGRSFELFVVDDHNHLVGAVPLRRLLTALPNTPVWAIRDAEVVSVGPDTDQEEVARLVAKYDLVSIPVVDRSNRLIGTISVEDVVDIVGEEASEDIFRLAGSDAAELERRSPARIAVMRLPWILATLLIELCAGVVIHYYDETLAHVILLASFMPVIQAISGNTGLQSVTMVVRGLATGHVQLARWWEPLWHQVQTTSIIGAVCAVVVAIIGSAWHGTRVFGLVVGLSMFISVNLSGLAGTGFPMVSKRLGFDPALTAGPFETAFQDVIGVTIFLTLATLLLRWIG
ncbi:MAG TPA: magnesium transporter [Methylomirabilota bacterium]